MSNGYRILALAALLSGLIGPVLAAPGDMEAIAKASDLDRNPDDAKAIATVCTACHAASQFLTAPRPYLRWEQTMQDMLDRGAVATDEQLDQILAYLVRNLTIVNVNKSPADQLAMTLQIPGSVAQDIVARRSGHAFTSPGELLAVTGIDPAVVKKLQAKGLLQF